MPTEVWKDIIGYEGLYQVSNSGKVRSMDRLVSNQYASYFKKGKIIKTYSVDYEQITLCVDGVKKYTFVHILVATAFIDNVENKSFVNHKDGIKLNNSAANLEWVTRSENQIHAYEKGLQKPKRGAENICSKPIIQLTPDNIEINRFASIKAAADDLKLLSGSIGNCLRGRNLLLHGFKFIYA